MTGRDYWKEVNNPDGVVVNRFDYNCFWNIGLTSANTYYVAVLHAVDELPYTEDWFQGQYI